MKLICAILLIFLPARAMAWEVLAPPDYYYQMGLLVRKDVEYVSPEFVARYCDTGPLPQGWRYYGCSLVNPVVCVIYISSDIPKWFVPEVLRHEIAHCAGWRHD